MLVLELKCYSWPSGPVLIVLTSHIALQQVKKSPISSPLHLSSPLPNIVSKLECYCLSRVEGILIFTPYDIPIDLSLFLTGVLAK